MQGLLNFMLHRAAFTTETRSKRRLHGISENVAIPLTALVRYLRMGMMMIVNQRFPCSGLFRGE